MAVNLQKESYAKGTVDVEYGRWSFNSVMHNSSKRVAGKIYYTAVTLRKPSRRESQHYKNSLTV